MNSPEIIKNDFTPLVSFIIPICNSERYLFRCLDSVINQSYKNIELILIDDGSTDGSGKTCDVYAAKDNRIKSIHIKNSGPAAARNFGISGSKGEFIFFLDSDDEVENNAIELLVENYKQTGADLIVGDFKIVKNDIHESRKDIILSKSELLDKQEIVDHSKIYLKKPSKYLLFAYSWGRLFKASIIKNNNIVFDESLFNFEDVTFNFDYLKHTQKIFFLKEIIYSHRVYDSYASATTAIGNNFKKLFDFRAALMKISDFLTVFESASSIKKQIGHANVFLTIVQLVRICGQIDIRNKKAIYEFIKTLVNDQNFRNNLQFYSPTENDSKIIPILMKLKFVWPVILVCKYKANKRYKNSRKNI